MDKAATVIEDRHVTNEWSSEKPVAQMTAPGVSRLSSSKRTSVPDASTVRPRSWMPCRRRAVRGLDPISASRSCMRCPSLDVTVLPISPVASR